MKFYKRPTPTVFPGWWGCSVSLMNDRLQDLGCDYKVDRGFGKRRTKCRNSSRYYQAQPDGRPVEKARVLCLVHFLKEVGYVPKADDQPDNDRPHPEQE